MEFTAECGCRIEYPEMSLLSDMENVENFRPMTKFICQEHKYELLVKYLEIFDTITLAQVKRIFRLPESEAISLIRKIEREHPENISITVHNFTVTRIN